MTKLLLEHGAVRFSIYDMLHVLVAHPRDLLPYYQKPLSSESGVPSLRTYRKIHTSIP
jgi:hypothetical protein